MFKTIIKNFFTQNNLKLLLGRWKIEYNKNIINKKIYFSNIDNCGISGNLFIK
jgi:hypothetical protein